MYSADIIWKARTEGSRSAGPMINSTAVDSTSLNVAIKRLPIPPVVVASLNGGDIICPSPLGRVRDQEVIAVIRCSLGTHLKRLVACCSKRTLSEGRHFIPTYMPRPRAGRVFRHSELPPAAATGDGTKIGN